MTEKRNNVYYSALGGKRGNPLSSDNMKNTLENMKNISWFFEHLKNKNRNLKIKKLLDDEKNYELPIWGLGSVEGSNKGLVATKLNSYISEGAIIFYGYKNCICYIGEVLEVIHAPEMSELLWQENGTWDYCIILKKLIKVYIPRNKLAFEDSIELRANLMSDKYIEKVLEEDERFGFEWIINRDKSKKGNFQGNYQLKSTDTILVKERLKEYFLRTNFEGLIKVVCYMDEVDE